MVFFRTLYVNNTYNIFDCVHKGRNDENVCHLEITEGILVHCNLVNTSYQQNLRI